MSSPSSRTDRTVLGIGLAFVSFALLSGADAITKVLSAHMSIFQIAIIDGIFAMIIVLPIVIKTEGVRSLRPRRPWMVIARCVVAAGSLVTAYLSFERIPLADAYAIAFIAPLAVTALAAPALGERVGWRQWVAVVIGFAAVIVILRPSLNSIELGQLYIFISALLFALSLLILRGIAGTESRGALIWVYFVCVSLMGLPLGIAQWTTPSWSDLGLLLVMGACASIGNLLLIQASRLAPASIVSSFMYSQLLWGVVFGVALFGDLPDLITIGGAAVIIVCGLYTLWHASSTARAAALGGQP